MRLDYTEASPGGVKAFGGVYGYVMQSASKTFSSTWSICA